jgi:uncharacterized protein YgiM (DUF1202 family)
MRKPSRTVLVSAGIFLLATLLIAETLVVKIRTTNLRKQPKFYAQTLTVLKTGERLEKLGSQNGWIRVKTSLGLTGWIHSSAVETKKFSLFSSNQTLKTGATADEVVLAAKGFNKKVEEEYKAEHPNINFALVDKMLKIEIPPSEMEAFLKKGKLGEFRGTE